MKLSTLQEKADKAMSVYIRMKYSDEHGMCKCVSCDRVLRWQEMDAAHFIPKSRGFNVRYIEENVHPACPSCNRFQPESHMIGYTLYMIDMYGREKVEELQNEGRVIVSPSERRNMSEYWRDYYINKLKDLGND